MISSVYWEWELLIVSIKTGIKLYFIYDLILIFRVILSHRKWVESLEDVLFWVYASGVLFQLQLEYSKGVVRGFSILGVMSGMVLFQWLIGRTLIRMVRKRIYFLKAQLTKMLKLFKIKLCRQRDENLCNRRKNGAKKNSGKKKETE